MKKNIIYKVIYTCTFIVAIVLDFIVKKIVSTGMDLYETIPVIKDVFHITYVENTGAAFSIMSGKTVFLSVLTAVVVLFLLFLLFTDKIKGVFPCFMITLIAAGGVGNLIDRVFRGSVVDMFDFRLINFAVFNVADIFVTCGAILFLLCFIFSKGDVLQWNTSSKKKTKDSD